MKVEIKTRRIAVDAPLRDHITQRLRFVLGRFGDLIASATVRLDDPNGNRGGVDKQCQLELTLRPSGQVLIRDIDSDLRTVIARAVERASRAVERDVQRRRELRML